MVDSYSKTERMSLYLFTLINVFVVYCDSAAPFYGLWFVVCGRDVFNSSVLAYKVTAFLRECGHSQPPDSRLLSTGSILHRKFGFNYVFIHTQLIAANKE